jgi:hypothetical protein
MNSLSPVFFSINIKYGTVQAQSTSTLEFDLTFPKSFIKLRSALIPHRGVLWMYQRIKELFDYA